MDLVGAIYDAVIDPSRWDDTVDRIRRHLGFHLCMLTAIAVPSGKMIVGAQSNVPHPYAETAYQYGSEALALWGGVERIGGLAFEEPMIHTDYSTSDSWIGNPFYEEWGKPQGLVDQLVLILEHNSRMFANIAFGVHESGPPISEAQVEGLRILAPHLRRATIISGLLDGRAQAAESFEAALSALGSAVVLTDERMNIVYANARAEQMLVAGDPLARLNGRLDLPRELVRGQLEAAIGAAAMDAGGLPRGSGIPVRRADGSGVIVHVLPLTRRQLTGIGRAARGQPVAAVFVAEPNAELNLPIEAIQMLYGLRPAETRVFELIASGLSAPRIAAALGVTRNTVKTHTARLFDKLGVHSRAELLRFARESSLGRQ
jgi:DNA-binding CsgD family transcriptional regulator